MTEEREILLVVQDLKKHFAIGANWLGRASGYIKAVDGVSFYVRSGETVGVVGESGSGKTTVARCLVRLYDLTGGEITVDTGQRRFVYSTFTGKDEREFRKSVQIIYQDPYASLNPRMNILDTVGEPLLVNGIAKGRELEARVTEMIMRVGLRVEYLRRFPHSFSGGQRQRIGIARALVVEPKLVIADEPVSALDVSVQAQTLNLLRDLQEELGLSYVFITHDMSVVRYMCDRILVMYAGKLVETAPKEDLLHAPRHPYTEMLLAAVPKVTQRQVAQPQEIARGEPPNLLRLPTGCVFHPRCPYAIDICRIQEPELTAIGPDRFVSCHRWAELRLRGVS